MRRKRWIKRVLAGFLAAGTAGGCKQQLFMEPADYHDAVLATLPRGIDTRPHDPIVPSQVNRIGPGPETILDTRPMRPITLKECIAIALEQGNTGIQSPTNFGFKNDAAAQFTGRAVSGSDSIRVFAIDPAIAAGELERSLSKFDARWINSMTWQKVDQPTAAQFLSFQNSRDAANLTTTLAKPLPTGGVSAITFTTDYSNFTNIPANQRASFVNPNYTPRVQFTFEQPLLRLFGIEANQLSPNHPGSQLLNLQPSGGAGTEGILISRIRLDQQKADFEVRVNFLLVNVEAAYWNLFAAYYNLYANEEGMRQAFEGFRFIQIRVFAGNEPPQSEYQARAQFERFRGQVYTARGQVLEAERQLRGLLGVWSDGSERLVPIDPPNESPYRPDFFEAANDALANLPALLQARQDLKAQQLNLLLQKNLRRPDLRAFGQYDIAGLGTRLDGRENINALVPGNALTSLANNNFNSWTIGFRMDIPIGFRDANALVREAQLNVARSYYTLRDEEMKALEFVVLQYRRVVETYIEIGPKRAEREALQIYLGKVKEVIDIGKWDPAYYQNYLTVQQQLAVAVAAEYRAIADYNTALATFEYAKGTIQQYNNVKVGEGPLPPWVQKKAADHIRERTEAAFKLRERDLSRPPAGPAAMGGQPVGPPVGTGLISELPPFAENRPPVPETLPDPKPIDPKNLPEPKPFDPKKPPVPPVPGGMGARPLPTFPAGPAQPPMRSAPAPSAGGADPAGDDYFRAVGTVSLPSRGATGSGPQPGTTGGSPAPAPLPRFPAGTGLDPLPIPPLGPGLPVPPPSAPPRAEIEFGPAGSIPPIPTPSWK
jgi:outer membrane protein TolC